MLTDIQDTRPSWRVGPLAESQVHPHSGFRSDPDPDPTPHISAHNSITNLTDLPFKHATYPSTGTWGAPVHRKNPSIDPPSDLLSPRTLPHR